MNKNVASQKLTVFAFDATTNLPKSGDAGNITAYVSIDNGSVTALADTSATEKDATNAKGYYLFDLAQAETNGDMLFFTAKSSTANVVCVCVPAVVYTRPANASLLSIDSNGRVDVIKVAGTTQTAKDIGAAVPSAVPGASGGLLIAGSNADTSFDSITLGEFVVSGDSVFTGPLSFASDIEASGKLFGIARHGLAQGATSTTITLANDFASESDIYNGMQVVYIGQARRITSYNGATRVATIDRAWAHNPEASAPYMLLHIDTPTVDSSGQTTVGAIASNAITAASIAADADTEIAAAVQTGMTAQGFTTTRAGKLDNLDAAVSSVGGGDATAANQQVLIDLMQSKSRS